MSDKIMISIVMPVYNAAPFLAQCFDSILSQQRVKFELLVVDDGSTDGSQDLCQRYAEGDSRIRLFRTDNRGPGAAKNLALSHAQGDAAAFIDADDYFEPAALQTLVAAWRETGADFIRCENRIFIDASHPPPNPAGIALSGPPQGKMPREGLVDIGYVNGRPRVRYWNPCGSSMVSLGKVRQHGVRFNERMRQGEDGWFMLELAKIPLSYHYCDAVVYNWRRHGYNSITLTSLHPLERIACKFFYYAELRKYLRSKIGTPLADRAIAHNYASVFVEMVLLYGGWSGGANFDPAAKGIATAIVEPLLVGSMSDFTPTGWREKAAKAFVRLGWARALALLGRHSAKNVIEGWSDFSGFDHKRIVDSDYTPFE